MATKKLSEDELRDIAIEIGMKIISLEYINDNCDESDYDFLQDVIVGILKTNKLRKKEEVILNNISKEDYIIWDNEKNEPLEDLDIVYHYTSIVELFNDDNFGLKGNEEIRCVAELPLKWQKRINQAIEDCKEIRTFNTTGMWGLGTPEDLKYYLENYA